MRRAIAVLAVAAVPGALLATTLAGAGHGRPAGPPRPGVPSGSPAAVQTGDTKKECQAAAQTPSRRGKRLRADDAATPPSPGTAPVMSVSSPLAAAPGDAGSATIALPGARAPPAGPTCASV